MARLFEYDFEKILSRRKPPSAELPGRVQSLSSNGAGHGPGGVGTDIRSASPPNGRGGRLYTVGDTSSSSTSGLRARGAVSILRQVNGSSSLDSPTKPQITKGWQIAHEKGMNLTFSPRDAAA